MSKLVQTQFDAIPLFTEDDEKLIRNFARKFHCEPDEVRSELWLLRVEHPDIPAQKIVSKLRAKLLHDLLLIPKCRTTSDDGCEFDVSNGKSVVDEEIELQERLELEQKMDEAVAENPLMFFAISTKAADLKDKLKLTPRRINQLLVKKINEIKDGSQPDFFGGAAA